VNWAERERKEDGKDGARVSWNQKANEEERILEGAKKGHELAGGCHRSPSPSVEWT